jgi:hypothetical protein
MAPSNLNQVFVANTTTTPALVAGAFSQTAASGLAANSKYGIWNLKGNAYITGVTTSTLMTSPGVLNTALSSVQFTQTMLSGNVIASPIIDLNSIRRIAFSKYKAPVRHAVGSTFVAGAVPAGQSYMFKIAVRTYPTIYEAFANPTNPDLDLSTGNKTFPLLGNFSAGRTVIPVVEIPAGTALANTGTDVVAAIQANKILNDMFTAISPSAGVVNITARHIGVVFDVACNNTATNSSAITTTVIAGAEDGMGHYLTVLSEEKSQRARYGNFNRMYFPMPFPTFAQSGTNYDLIEISYEHNWPSSTGIARAGELNNIKIYAPSQLAASTNTDIVFGLTATEMDITAGTTTEFLF